MQQLFILAWTLLYFTPTSLASGWLGAVKRSLTVNTGDLCFLTAERTTLLNDRLYFQGGDYTFANGDTSAQEKQLYWLDLNTSFPVDTIIPSNALRSISAQGSQAQLGGAFFTDALLTTMYGFSAANSTDPLDTVEAFNTTTQRWSNETVSGGSFNGIGRGGSGFATTSTSGLGLGFYIADGLNGQGPPGLITFDASTPSTLTWTKTFGGTPNVDATAMLYARYGKKGVLIVFGGYRNLFEADLYDMSEIFVYDIDSKTWFNVTADGEIPGPRSEFCSTISTASDDSASFITIYGGYNIHQGRAYEEVYVLEIPRFRWVNMTRSATGTTETQLTKTFGRYQHHCELYGERQMIVLGGNIITDGGSVVVNAQSCNTSYPAIRLLDTSTFEWQQQFTPGSQPYTIPPRVAQDVGGGPQGQVKSVTPTSGFNNSALTRIFNKTIPRLTVNPGSISTATNSTGGQPPLSTASASSSTPTGAIAGGVLGGVFAIAIIGVLLYFFCYRRRKKTLRQRGGCKESELSSHASVVRSRNAFHETHAEDRPHEIDSNGFVEAPVVHAPAKPACYEMSSSNE